MNRSAIREHTFQLLYSLKLQKIVSEEELEEQITLFIENNAIKNKEAQKYINEITKGTIEKKEEIQNFITQNLKTDWSIERISKVNLAILELAIYEIRFTDVPYKVVINEAVELAKTYGDDNSKAFVNGVMASIVKDRTEEN